MFGVYIFLVNSNVYINSNGVRRLTNATFMKLRSTTASPESVVRDEQNRSGMGSVLCVACYRVENASLDRLIERMKSMYQIKIQQENHSLHDTILMIKDDIIETFASLYSLIDTNKERTYWQCNMELANGFIRGNFIIDNTKYSLEHVNASGPFFGNVFNSFQEPRGVPKAPLQSSSTQSFGPRIGPTVGLMQTSAPTQTNAPIFTTKHKTNLWNKKYSF